MKIKDLLKDAYKEGMTLEEIETALGGIELPVDNSAELDRLKSALSKSNSEAADYKRQLKERMSAEEIKAKEDAEKNEELQTKYDALLKQVTIAENEKKLLALGYEATLAHDTAEAMVEGAIDKVFANQKKHLDAVEKKIRSSVLQETPKPEGGNADKTVTKQDLRKMSAQERHDFYVNHPEEYKELYGGNE